MWHKKCHGECMTINKVIGRVRGFYGSTEDFDAQSDGRRS